jgi:hypothetical protein
MIHIKPTQSICISIYYDFILTLKGRRHHGHPSQHIPSSTVASHPVHALSVDRFDIGQFLGTVQPKAD